MRNEINLSREQLQETAHNPNTLSKELGHYELEARNTLANECPFMRAAAVAHLHCLAPTAAVLALRRRGVGGWRMLTSTLSAGAIANGHNYWGAPWGVKAQTNFPVCQGRKKVPIIKFIFTNKGK